MKNEQAILFVDDESSVLNSLTRALHKEPFQVLSAGSGQEALDIMKNNKVNVIITDLHMPEMHGITLLKKVKKQYPDIVRIALSAISEKESVLKVFKSGIIFRYIIKPWENEKLKNVIVHALTLYDLQEEKRKLELKIERHIKKKI